MEDFLLFNHAGFFLWFDTRLNGNKKELQLNYDIPITRRTAFCFLHLFIRIFYLGIWPNSKCMPCIIYNNHKYTDYQLLLNLSGWAAAVADYCFVHRLPVAIKLEWLSCNGCRLLFSSGFVVQLSFKCIWRQMSFQQKKRQLSPIRLVNYT